MIPTKELNKQTHKTCNMFLLMSNKPFKKIKNTYSWWMDGR